MESSDQDQQQLAWSQEIPDYGNKLLKRLDEFRKTTILYDVCVHTRNADFNAHKVILAACGGIFRTCFVDEERKMISDARELTLDCPAQGLKPIIRFAYSGSLLVTKRNAVPTMIAAEVTKMKEVQEICAGIAVKEYGWVERFTGEKTPALIQKLRQVLLIHAPCFASDSEANGISDETNLRLPFATEVESEFAEHLLTYRRLAGKLLEAETITLAVASRKKTTECDVTKKVSDKAESNGDVAHNGIEKNSALIESHSVDDDIKTKSGSQTPDNSCATLPPNNKQPEAQGNSNNDENHSISTTSKSNKAQMDKEIKAVELEDETTTNTASASQSANSPIKKTPRKHIPPPAPRPKSTPESVKPENPIGDKAPDTHSDAAASPAPAARPVNSPAPRVKPRASMKMKKAPPPPPCAATPEKPSAPPRPAKVPQKVPPPRPKPPVKKKTSTSEAGEPQNIRKPEEYDDTLNPFV